MSQRLHLNHGLACRDTDRFSVLTLLSHWERIRFIFFLVLLGSVLLVVLRVADPDYLVRGGYGSGALWAR